MARPRKSSIESEMERAGFRVRWTEEDIKNKIPERLSRALAKHERGREKSGLARMLVIRWVELAEKTADPLSVAAAALVHEEEGSYGAREKKQKRL